MGAGRQDLRLSAFDRIPMPEPLGDELYALAIVASVQDAHVRWLGEHEDDGGARVHVSRPRREVPRCAVGGPDLARPFQLRRVPRPCEFKSSKEVRYTSGIKQVSSSKDLVLDADRPFASTAGAPKVRTRIKSKALPRESGESGWLRAAQCTVAPRSLQSEQNP
jgi:hypothetical protein